MTESRRDHDLAELEQQLAEARRLLTTTRQHHPMWTARRRTVEQLEWKLERVRNLSYLNGRLGDLVQELAEMPKYKKGSQWHQDRLELKAVLEKQIAREEAKQEGGGP